MTRANEMAIAAIKALPPDQEPRAPDVEDPSAAGTPPGGKKKKANSAHSEASTPTATAHRQRNTRNHETTDYDVVKYYLQHAFPDLKFELFGGFDAERKFKTGSSDPKYHDRVKRALSAMKLLLSGAFLERLTYSGNQLPAEVEVDFFADAYFDVDPKSRKKIAAPQQDKTKTGQSNRESLPIGNGLRRTTAMFELKVNEAWGAYKLDQLEIRLAFYRAYKAVDQRRAREILATAHLLRRCRPSMYRCGARLAAVCLMLLDRK